MFLHISYTRHVLDIKRVLLLSINTDAAVMWPMYVCTGSLELDTFDVKTETWKQETKVHPNALPCQGSWTRLVSFLPYLHAFCVIGKQKWLRALTVKWTIRWSAGALLNFRKMRSLHVEPLYVWCTTRNVSHFWTNARLNCSQGRI